MLTRRRTKYTLRSNYSKYLATHPNYYEISSNLSKLENIMRVQLLALNLSIKYARELFQKLK